MKVKRSFTVYRETAKEFKNKPKTVKVYSWASKFVNENMPYSLGEAFYWTEPAKRLLFKLQNVEGGFIGLVGLQGTGKTATLWELYHKLKAEMPGRTFYFQWTDQQAKHVKDLDLKAYFREPLSNEIADRSDFKTFKGRYVQADQFEARELLRKQFIETLDKELYDAAKIVFVDMGDYDKQSRGRMNTHLEQIRNFWLRTRRYNVSVAVSIQAEMFKGHFLFGKIDAVTLEPLKPEQLVEAYVNLWENTEPFTKDALNQVAQLSRGVFRRFMKYIQACIERLQIMGVEGLIDTEFVNETITFNVLAKDMDLELSDIFTHQQPKLEAVKILSYLRECKEPPNQKQIAETLGYSEPTVGRHIQKLEAYGYVQRKRDAHGQWLTTLKSASE